MIKYTLHNILKFLKNLKPCNYLFKKENKYSSVRNWFNRKLLQLLLIQKCFTNFMTYSSQCLDFYLPFAIASLYISVEKNMFVLKTFLALRLMISNNL